MAWAIPGGLAIGALLGTLVGRLIVHLRERHRETVGTDDFLALGLIALSYGLALMASTYGFLAVFAAGLALRRIERLSAPDDDPAPPAPPVPGAAQADADGETDAEMEDANEPEHSPQFMARAVLGFSEQLERIGTLGVVLMIGGMLTTRYLFAEAIWFVPLLFLVIRPLAVVGGLLGTPLDPVRTGLMSWFGIRASARSTT